MSSAIAALSGSDEAGTLAAFKALRKDFIEPLVADHRGRTVKSMGDGFLIEFASGIDAVRAAIAWQESLRERRDPIALTFRIGVNLGDIVTEEGDIHGDGVNIAARLESVAQPGGVCIADVVHQNVVGKSMPFFGPRRNSAEKHRSGCSGLAMGR